MEQNILVKVGADISNFSRNIKKVADGISMVGREADYIFQDLDGRWRNAKGQFVKVNNEVSSLGGAIGKAATKARTFARNVSELAAGIGLFQAVSKAIGAVSRSLDGAISRYDTLNNFPRVLQQIGFSAQDSKRAISRLSDGIQGLPTTLDDVAKTAQRLAVMTGDLSGAVETTLALNNAFISSGASAADASRGLEQYVQMLSTGTVDLQSWRTLQETMGVALNDVAKSFGFAGASAQSDLYNALKDGVITFDEFNSRIIELSNATGGFAERALTASGGIKTAWTNMKTAIVRGTTNIISAIDSVLVDTQLRSIENIITKMGKGFFNALDGIAKAIPVVADGIRDLIKAIEPWKEQIKTATALLVGLSVGFATFKFATYATGFLSITKALKVLKSGLETVALSSMLLWDTLRKNPLITIISVIAGLAAGFAYLYKTSEPFRHTVDKIGATLKGVFLSAVTQVRSGLNRLNSALSGLKQAFTKIVPFFSMLAAVFRGAWVATIEKMSSAFVGLKAAFSGFAQTKAVPFFERLADVFRGAWVASAEKATVVFAKFKDVLTELVKAKVEPFIDAISKLFQGDFNSVAQSLGQFVPTILAAILGGVPAIIISLAKYMPALATGIEQYLPVVLDGVTKGINTVFSAIATYLPQFVQAGVDVIVKMVEGLSQALPVILPAIVTALTTIITTVASYLPVIIRAGAEILTKLIDGLIAVIPYIIPAIITVITAIITTIADAVPVFVDAGLTVITGLVNGITNAIPKVIDAVLSIVTSILTVITKNLPILINAGITVLTGLINGIVSALPKLAEVGMTIINSILQLIVDNIPLIFNSGIQVLEAIINGILSLYPALIEAGLQIIFTLVQAIIMNLPTLLDAGIQILTSLIDGIISILPTLLETGIMIIVALVATVIDSLPKIFDSGIQILIALIDGLIKVLPKLIEAVLTLVVTLIATIIQNLPKIFDAGGRILSSLISGIFKLLPNLIQAGFNLIVKLVGSIISNLPQIIAAGGQILLSLISGIIKVIPQLLSVGGQLISQLKGVIASKVTEFFNIGADLIKGLWNGIKSVGSWLKNKVDGFFNGIVGGIKGLFGIKSPSRVFRDEIGKMLPLGLVDGITAMKNDVVRAAETLAEWATPEPPNVSLAYATPNGIYGTLSSAVNGTVDVNSRDDMLVAAVEMLAQKLDGLTVEMDGKKVGKIVAPTVSREIYSESTNARWR